MIHFDRFLDDKNEGTGAFGMISGGLIMMLIFKYAGKLIILLGIWGPVVATFVGAIGTVISGMLLIIAKDFYENKLKPKWFKTKKDEKQDTEKRA